MNQDLTTKEEIVFTCGFFGDAFDVYRLCLPSGEFGFFVRWRPSIGKDLSEEFWDNLKDHMDDDDEEFARWEATVTEKNTPEAPPDPAPSQSFEQALDQAEIGMDLLRGEPVFIHRDIRVALRRCVERLFSNLTEEERRSFSENAIPTSVIEWFELEWPDEASGTNGD